MRILALLALAACAGSPNHVEIQLAPDVISSLDGTTTVSALVASESGVPLDGVAVHMTVDYTDRNGTAHTVMPVDGKTDARGVFTQKLVGLTWDGHGTVTVAHGDKVTGSATFTVLDRTPPVVVIKPPTTNNHVGPGLPLDVQVHVTDEIGISDVVLDSTLGIQGTRSTVIASGSQDSTITFRLQVPQNPGVTTFDLHALASDLSGNIAVADALTLTIDPAITIATPPPLSGMLITDGTTTQLANPLAIAASPKDGKLYVADTAQGACNQHCIWQVDPTTGTVTATPVYANATGTIEGIAFDATGDNLYFTVDQNQIGALPYTASTGYTAATATVCDDPAAQNPQNPFHLVFDSTLGLLTPDDQSKELSRVATCAATTSGTSFTNNSNWDAPRGIAEDPSGNIYVSDFNRGRISMVNPSTMAVSTYGGDYQAPYGLEWLGTSTTQFASSLMVADNQGRVVVAQTASGQLTAAYLRNNPIDLAFIGGTMYVLTTPSGTNRGRIYAVTGF